MELALGRLTRHSALLYCVKDEAGDRWEKTTAGRVLFNAIVPTELAFKNHDMKKKALSELVFESYRKRGPRRHGAVPRPPQGIRLRQRHARRRVDRHRGSRDSDGEGAAARRKPRSASSGSSARTRPATSRTASATTKSSTPGRTPTPTSPTRWSSRCASRRTGSIRCS